MASYRLFGLNITTDVALSDRLAPATFGSADVEIRRGSLIPEHEGWSWTERSVTWHDASMGAISVRDGKTILVDATATDETWLREFLIGPALAIVLHQRGYLVLHGSAVLIGARATLILGETGWGKSTLGAALDQAGCPLIADDLLPIRGRVLIPGLARAKLLPDAIVELGLDGGALEDLGEKRAWSRALTAEPTTIARIVVLDPNDTPEVRLDPLPAAAAIMELVRHTFVVRRITPPERAENLRRCAALSDIPTFTLRGPRTLTSLKARVSALK
jgi:hypothetical protein